MAQTPDNDAWLEHIRCPQYFDFEAALTIPCPSGADINPPLRDSCYESDDETRTFFQALEADFSLHNTPHPQENSPPRPELRNLRPIYRHRPTTTFEEYLRHFGDSQHVNPTSASQSPMAQPTNSPQHTPSPQQKAPLTPRRNPRGKLSRIPLQTTALSNSHIKTPTQEAIPMPPSLKKNPSTPGRLAFHTSTELTRKSAPNEPVPLRRRRLPERITPPSNLFASKTTSGGFGRGKSRKAIARSEGVDGQQEHTSPIRKCASSCENTLSSKKNLAKIPSEEKENAYNRGREPNLLDADPDILRMMEEHNRRIQQKQVHNEGKTGKENLQSDNTDTVNNRTREQKLLRRTLCITFRNKVKEAPREEALQWDENKGKRDLHIQRKVSSLKGEGTLKPEDRRLQWDGNVGNGDWQINLQASSLKGMDALEPDGPHNVGHRQIEWEAGLKVNQQVQKTQTQRRTASSFQRNESSLSGVSHDDSKPDESSLDQLLKFENERVLEERKKRLPERRRALQLDKNVALKTLEGQRSEQDRQRTLARVEYTSASSNSREGTSAFFHMKREEASDHLSREKRNRNRDRSLSTKPRTRGLKGFREKPKIGPPRSLSSGISTAPSGSQKPRTAPSTRRRQPYTDKIKAAERQKRLEKRLEEDLQSLLSEHNTRVQGNRRACAADER